MGNITYVAFPYFVLIISILMGGGTLMGATTPVCFSSNTVSCTNQNNGFTLVNCALGVSPCKVSSSCTPVLLPPAFCFFGAQYILPGESTVVPTVQQAGSVIFNFGSIGTSGVILMIAVGVGVAVLAGLTILGSGLNQESIHIMFMAGLLLGIYAFLCLIDGFGTPGNITSFFTQLNAGAGAVGFPVLGTILFIIMSVIEAAGILSFISRGGTVA